MQNKQTREQIKKNITQVENTIKHVTKLDLLTELLYIQQEYFIVNNFAIGSQDLGRASHQYTFQYKANSIFQIENISTGKSFKLFYFPKNSLNSVHVCHFKAELS